MEEMMMYVEMWEEGMGEKWVEDMEKWEEKVNGWGVSVKEWKGWDKCGLMGEWRFWREMGGFEDGKLFGKMEGVDVRSEWMDEMWRMGMLWSMNKEVK